MFRSYVHKIFLNERVYLIVTFDIKLYAFRSQKFSIRSLITLPAVFDNPPSVIRHRFILSPLVPYQALFSHGPPAGHLALKIIFFSFSKTIG